MGKGDKRRPSTVSDDCIAARWAATFSEHQKVECPNCKRDVKDYVREHGRKWCPWCNVEIRNS